jgi:hypothetical protein
MLPPRVAVLAPAPTCSSSIPREPSTVGPMVPMVTYIGLRGMQPEHGHGGRVVVGVVRGEKRSNLVLEDDRHVDADFEWGYEGAGPRRLAQAILNDFTGRKVELVTANAFLHDVVAYLPNEFELEGDDVAAWLEAHTRHD